MSERVVGEGAKEGEKKRVEERETGNRWEAAVGLRHGGE